jgi:hypothetical protein
MTPNDSTEQNPNLVEDLKHVEERDPVLYPEEGDILQRADGVYVLVDYIDGLNVGFMCTNKVTGIYRLKDWAKWMKDSTTVERGSSKTWTLHLPTREESTNYLQQKTDTV